MGIQDRDYWHERQREQEGLPPRRPNFSKTSGGNDAQPGRSNRRFRVIDEVRFKAQPLEISQPERVSGGYAVAWGLIAVLAVVLAYLGYKVAGIFF